MIVLFKPYLNEKVTKSYYVNNIIDAKTTTVVHPCRWIGCCKIFKNLNFLSNHVVKEHANPKEGGIYFCGWSNCNRGNKGFNARYKMLVHIRTHTNEKPHQCYECSKSFSRAENLKIHMRSHTGEKPYVCSVPGCGKAYSNSSDRFKHSRTHIIDKPYICRIPGCSKRYTDPSSLRKHVKTYKHFKLINSNGVLQDTSKSVKYKNLINHILITERINSEKQDVNEANIKYSSVTLLKSNQMNESINYDSQTYVSSSAIMNHDLKLEPLDLRIHYK